MGEPCKHCGHCPACGQPTRPVHPWYGQPYSAPVWPVPTYPVGPVWVNPHTGCAPVTYPSVTFVC